MPSVWLRRGKEARWDGRQRPPAQRKAPLGGAGLMYRATTSAVPAQPAQRATRLRRHYDGSAAAMRPPSRAWRSWRCWTRLHSVSRAKRAAICDGPSLGRNAAKSFAASKTYDILTWQVVAIHTQRRQKPAAPLAMAREANSTSRKIGPASVQGRSGANRMNARLRFSVAALSHCRPKGGVTKTGKHLGKIGLKALCRPMVG